MLTLSATAVLLGFLQLYLRKERSSCDGPPLSSPLSAAADGGAGGRRTPSVLVERVPEGGGHPTHTKHKQREEADATPRVQARGKAELFKYLRSHACRANIAHWQVLNGCN